jgi:hypothetical protein
MRICAVAIIAAAACLPGSGVARADHAPAIVVPGRADVPVIIDGRDASYAIVEGDWGLFRPGQMAVEIYGNHAYPMFERPHRYFPATGHRPSYGRREMIPPPNAPLPPPAERYRRFWGAASDSVPASLDPPSGLSSVAGELREDRRFRHRHRHHHRRPQQGRRN